ncbi:hypothetical protein FHS31_002327 [Sphingomonas vulcanisoli]|uniref:Trypsin-like serine protease n=1 Tax=Sphingomonas vulcanisoli TaxID=1658060 RepID=A0ABX0TTC4_9SPHN|nr:hypothetical protein [Sphingomonas vulcanisoli]NIJ08706.1 hypothetical protein [Sphingomonas vulcanisoli]
MLGIALLAAQLAAAQAATAAQDPTIVIARQQPLIETPLEALVQDGIQYARLYPIPLIEAVRRLVAQEASVPQTDALIRRYQPRFAGLVLEHVPVFRFVMLLTGDEPVPDTVITAGGLTIPIVFRTGAPATRDQILTVIAAHQAEIRAALPRPMGLAFNPRTGRLLVMLRKSDLDKEGEAATAQRLQAIAGVPLELHYWSAADRNTAAEGGGRIIARNREGKHFLCTSGFVVTNGTQTAITTAAHCPDTLAYIEADKSEVPLTLIGAWGERYQDVQIHSAPAALEPLFHADSKDSARLVTGWRNRESTRAGDIVCHRGEKTGYSCAEIAYVDYAPPGDLCAGPCMATWVAVKGPSCKNGDSGGPVFLGTVAFGLVKADSVTDGVCKLYYYMSTDYLPPGWTVAHR